MDDRRQQCQVQYRMVILEAHCVECGVIYSQTITTAVLGPGRNVYQIACDEHVGRPGQNVLDYARARLGAGGRLETHGY